MTGRLVSIGPILLLVLVAGFGITILPASGPGPSWVGMVATSEGPLEGARVRIAGDSSHATTDVNGRFSLFPSRPSRNLLTTWAEGYFIAGVPAGTTPITLQPLPTRDCERYEWVDPTPDPLRPTNCGNCHGRIYREWERSGHARSARGLHFRNLFDGTDARGRPDRGWSLLADHPDGAGVCTSCHAPTVASNDPAYFDLRLARGVGALGVHCDYCHKIAGTRGEVGLTHGRFGLELRRPAEGQLFFGPLDDVGRGEDAHLPLYRQSRYCAPCHEGTVFGVHVYSTYSEWLDSPARRQGKQCQDCHAAPTGSMANVAPGRGGIERDPATLSNHRFVTTDLETMLRNSITLRLDSRRFGEGVAVTVTVEAWNVGHAVPTGFIDRHLELQVDAVDAGGREVFPREGPTLVSGRGGKQYARRLRDFDGRSPVPFWRADPGYDDTRLRPGEADRLPFLFPPSTRVVQARLLYRRFWPEVAEAKGWKDWEKIVTERSSWLAP